MKTFNEFITEVKRKNYGLTPAQQIVAWAEVEGLKIKHVKKISSDSFKSGAYTFVRHRAGEWQILKNSKEVDYLFNVRDDDMVDKMVQYLK
ncbi:hypothetical protein vBSdyM006_129 [Shigella phage vB_SdyM_006]|nr:hypothetical protein vBSdyM006_129 [Shigella phage vB_SdyM_006]